MPGIAGIIDFKADTALIDQNINQMANILDHTSPSTSDVCVLGHAALAAVSLKRYLYHDLLACNDETAVAFWGYFWDEEDLKKRTGVKCDSLKDISLGELLLNLHIREGLKGFCNLNGRFVISLWDKCKKTLTLINDRYGFCNLFYWVNSDRILFSSEYKAIIWHEDFLKKIDEQGMADFMTLGFSTEDRTFFENIKLLPPASIAIFKEDGNLSIRKYWDYSFHNEDDPVLPEQYYVDKFAEILTTVTKRQINPGGRICLPLSGGLDSRTLAGVLSKIGHKSVVKTLFYGNPYCYDVIYGRKIAKKAGFDHSYIPIEATYLKDNSKRFVWLTEGTVNCLNAHMLLTYPFIRKNNLDAVVTGFLGDTLSGSGSYLKGTEGEVDDEVLLNIQYDLLADIINADDMVSYMRQDLYESVRGKTFEVMRSHYYQCPSGNKYFRTRYLNIHERQRRYTSFNLYIFDFVANVVSPFLDYDFVDFILHVPSALMVGRNLYKKMLIKHLPKVASAPYNKTRLPLNASWIREGLHWRWERLVRNPLVKVTIGRRHTKMDDNYLHTDKAIRTGSRDFVIMHIKDNPFLAEYFNMDRVHQMLDDHMSGKSNEYGKITALLTFALWGKMFVDSEKPMFM